MTTSTTSIHQITPPPRFGLAKLKYSPRWLGAGVVLGTLSTLAVQWGGSTSVAALGVAGLAGASYATLVEPRHPILEHVTLRIPNLPPELAGLRIGQLSDLHLGHPYSHANTHWAVHQMERERPDLLLLTGDFVSTQPAIADLPDLLRPLQAPLGIYAVPGNHDYWEGLDEIITTLQPLGIEFLVNKSRVLQWGTARFWLAGVDDMWGGGTDLALALTDVPADAFTLLMAHAPDLADVAAQYNIAVQFSGHTHGGHLRLPWLGSFCLPRHGTRYAAGFEQVGSLQVYVSRGLGGRPLRLGCRPEATIFTLMCK